MEKDKPFTIDILLEITDLYESGEISYSKMVEMLNEIAIKWHENHIGDTNKMVEHHIVDTNKMINMNKEFIPYEQALALKELGFDEECLGYYNIDPSLKHIPFNPFPPFEHEWCLPAPLYQQAFRWFREKYDLFISITHYENGYSTNDLRRFDIYEEAELACLNKLIEIIKNK